MFFLGFARRVQSPDNAVILLFFFFFFLVFFGGLAFCPPLLLVAGIMPPPFFIQECPFPPTLDPVTEVLAPHFPWLEFTALFFHQPLPPLLPSFFLDF